MKGKFLIMSRDNGICHIRGLKLGINFLDSIE
jgi:hypothetical protein